MYKCKTCGVRFPESKDTVFYNRHLTEVQIIYAREVTDFLITNVGLSQIEVDEMWSFVKKNKRKLTKEMLEQINKATAGYTLESNQKQNSI